MEDIRFFGPRPSGKLVYLTTLACWPNPIPQWSQVWNFSIRYLACSAFAMIGSYAILNVWRLFGLVASVYWLLICQTDP